MDTLSHSPFVNAVHVVKDNTFDIIKPLYRDDMFFSIRFESLSKESRTQEKTDKFDCLCPKCEHLYYN